MTLIDSSDRFSTPSKVVTFYDLYWKEFGYFTNPAGTTMKVHFMTARPLGLVVPGGCRRFGQIEDGAFSTRIDELHPMWQWAAERLVEGLKLGEAKAENIEYPESEALAGLVPAESDRYEEAADIICVVAYREADARERLELLGYKERDTRI